MQFIPHHNKIEVRPLQEESPILAEKDKLLEVGEVLQVGDEVTWVGQGDILFFVAHGMWKTPDMDGTIHYLVTDHPDFILGKISHVAEQPV